ncbi:F0F1 ATP synthase subunit epsilon [Lutibaculum baratangense]|uniref:ATP synthase epsilon chain n=1 Tax=Lutibaculum baratangense AMV1 TaxID=631454 RepID=V4RM89_9HYPH|nr:F0F1 ATP synthase subunit epsilon [Lutibaculum baratangense]ESR26379.1 ATP synthase epsilon chain [Lutibaculum baratangense AMV1]
MADNFHFELVAPERLLLSEEVEQVDVPGTEGDFGVLANHMPLVSTLRPGVLVVRENGQAKHEIFVRGGFAEVRPNKLIILAEQAIPVSEIDQAEIDRQIRDAEEDVQDAPEGEARVKAEQHLAQLREVNDVLRTNGHV